MKMSTTTIFIEYLLIGLVSIIGLFAAINIVIGPENLSMYYSSLSLANSWIPIESLDVKIIFLILLYPFGIVFDKLSSKFFKSFDKSKIMLDQIYFSYEDSLNGLESSIQRAERNKSDDRMTVFTDKNSILLEQYMRNKHIVLLIRTISMVLIINTIAYCFISMNIVANTMILVLLLMRIIDVSFVEFLIRVHYSTMLSIYEMGNLTINRKNHKSYKVKSNDWKGKYIIFRDVISLLLFSGIVYQLVHAIRYGAIKPHIFFSLISLTFLSIYTYYKSYRNWISGWKKGAYKIKSVGL